MSTENDSSNVVEEKPQEEPTAEPAVEETAAPEKEETKECNHPANTVGFHQKGPDGTCIYCGHKV